jgi:hypothetical protein
MIWEQYNKDDRKSNDHFHHVSAATTRYTFFSGFMGEPNGQLKSSANPGMLVMTPVSLNSLGECRPVSILNFSDSGLVTPH